MPLPPGDQSQVEDPAESPETEPRPGTEVVEPPDVETQPAPDQRSDVENRP